LRYFLTYLIAFSLNIVVAQNLITVKQWKVEDITDITFDQYNGIYLADELGTITKYDLEGNQLLSYSSEMIFPINTIDVSHTNKIFGFYQTNQSYILLDRYLNVLNQSTFNPDFIGFAVVAAFSSDNNLWIFDGSDFTLKKLNLITGKLMTSIALSLIITENHLDIIQIDEYQNRLYLNNQDKNILVLDNMGNFIKSLPVQPEGKFCFNNNNIVYIRNNTISLYDIYNNDIMTIGTFTEGYNPLKIIQLQEEYYLAVKDKIIVLK